MITRMCGHASPHSFKEDGAPRKAYLMPKTLGILPRGVTCVIDKGCVIRHVFSSAHSAERHVAKSRELSRALLRGGRELERPESP